MITAFVTSDNHLGTYYARLRPERLEQRRKHLQAAFARVVDAAIERHADIFLHAGDLFDRPDPRNADRAFVARQIQRLRDADIPVFAIAGNHDSPRGYGYDGSVVPLEDMEALSALHLFRNIDQLRATTLTIRDTSVCIWGMSSDFNRASDACPLEESLQQRERGGDIDLVLLHYGVEGWAQPFQQEPCLSLANLDALAADAICVGHLHTRNEQRLPGGAVLLNPGATEHIHFGEEHLDCGYWILHCQPGHVETEYVRLTPQPMFTLLLDMETLLQEAEGSEEPPAQGAPDPLLARIRQAVKQKSRQDQLLRVRFTGRLPRSRFHALDLAAILTSANADNFHCQLDTERLVLYDPTEGWDIEIGFSFDVREEINAVEAMLLRAYGDNETEQRICRLAAEQLRFAYNNQSGGAQ